MAEHLSVGHLRGILDLLSDNVEVRIAVSPTDPAAYTVGEPAITGDYESGTVVLTLPAADPNGSVSADAAEQMGWTAP
ncbi:hypothetical protein ACIRCZ_03175 [Leifsonia sp. NPDC102414]|uniref:hypothetical protein n=1 Tax=Leifsonia sp. NPDC102414 TaxID=3364124 RepID=UPI0037FA6F1E